MPPKPARLWPDSATILERSRGVFFSQWEELLRLRRAVMNSFDLDDIHDLRVASRRFRATLELFYPFAPKDSKRELRKSVRKLTRMLGGLRNIDEALLFFRSRFDADGSAEFKLGNALLKLRLAELKRIKKALAAFDNRSLDRMVRAVIGELKENSIADRNSVSLPAYFSDVSLRLYLPIQRLLAVSTKPELRASRHLLRIAIKKWRYFFEIFAQILDRDYASHLGLLREYQTILGRMNDISEFGLLLGNLDLPKKEQEYARAALLKEDALLLQNLTELIERKPLTYTFLI
ncbi:MAG: CHAD domain-containing protein [Desulfuromonadaceae bacterium]|nr:CHAD domain-containing protein [Desulfuromonadaceae bacterium]